MNLNNKTIKYELTKAKRREYNRTYKLKHKDLVRRTYRNKLLRDYGLTQEEYDRMLISQNNKCVLCDSIFAAYGTENYTKEHACLDHDHKTNKVRELLCFRCNTALGMVKENTLTLDRMIKYIQKWSDPIT